MNKDSDVLQTFNKAKFGLAATNGALVDSLDGIAAHHRKWQQILRELHTMDRRERAEGPMNNTRPPLTPPPVPIPPI